MPLYKGFQKRSEFSQAWEAGSIPVFRSPLKISKLQENQGISELRKSTRQSEKTPLLQAFVG